MGTQLSFTEENIKKNAFDYPKLKLSKGEQARLTKVENPYSEYVHQIEKPILDERGNVIYITKQSSKGTDYQVPRTTFVSNPICLGDREVLDTDGIDPDNCPACARAAAGEKGYRPKRRFAMHVIKTNTKPKSFDPVEPYSGQLVIWAFSETVFNKLYGFQKEHGLDTHDLLYGPCTDEQFQKAELAVAGDTVVDEATRALIFAEKNRSEDPTVFCGTRKTKAALEGDIATVDAQWAKSNGEETDATASAEALNSGIRDLLDEGEEKKEEAKPAKSFDDLPASAPAAPANETKDLDSILDSL